MNRPLEPVSLSDPAPRRAAGKLHPPAPAAEAKAVPEFGKVHPAPRPLTFLETFLAMFFAVLAAAAVVLIVATIWRWHAENERQDKEVNELLHRP
jgi:hypothetical protein